MYCVGEAKRIKLHAPDDAYFSYFNSPYFSHSHASAIDIYPYHQAWGGTVLAPITGKVVKIQETKMGRKKMFPTEDYDFGIGIQPEGTQKHIVRLLHCRPSVKEGDNVNLGDEVGTTIRSRYFNYWTGPHYHIEVMNVDSFRRSTQSYPLTIPFRFEARRVKEVSTETEFVVSSVSKDNIMGYPKDFLHLEIGNYSGLSALDTSSSELGIIDGGLSHYNHGGVIGHENVHVDSIIGLQNIPVGVVHQSMEYASYFWQSHAVISYLDNNKLRGLSCFIYPKKWLKKGVPPLILVPKSYGEFTNKCAEGDVLMLKLESN
jgi:murein DD-endopeptidase MepM/ murein hydrolase activator NlpD